MAQIVNSDGAVRGMSRKAHTPALSTARRRGYTIPADAKVIIGKVRVQRVVMSHFYNATILCQDTRKPITRMP